jgi:hypothetical protein
MKRARPETTALGQQVAHPTTENPSQPLAAATCKRRDKRLKNCTCDAYVTHIMCRKSKISGNIAFGGQFGGYCRHRQRVK